MLLSRRLSKRFKEEEQCTGRAAYDDLISRMHSGLQETLEEIEQLPMSEQASFHVMRVQNGASAVLFLCLTARECTPPTAVLHQISSFYLLGWSTFRAT